jgi:hypothetical protein
MAGRIPPRETSLNAPQSKRYAIVYNDAQRELLSDVIVISISCGRKSDMLANCAQLDVGIYAYLLSYHCMQ